MRSFIDEISRAEQEAELIRHDAVTKAKEKVSETSIKAAESLEQLKEEERTRTKNAVEKAEFDGEAKEAELLAEYDKQAEAVCIKAEEKLDDAISYLLNRIQGLA